MVDSSLPRTEINGSPATAAQLTYPAVTNFGHFTAMQVRNGTVRGLGLHMSRLDAATVELFGIALDTDRARDHLRHALAEDVTAASARLAVFMPPETDEPSIMVTIRPPVDLSPQPRSLRSVEYQRPVAHIKHVGGFGQLYFGDQARRAGFDDALLVDHRGEISEGTVTNIGFWDGETVTWPGAPCLAGITMQLLTAGLPGVGVPCHRAHVRLADIPDHRAAFITNSQGIAPVVRIDDLGIPVDVALMRTLSEVYEAVPAEVI